MNNNDNNNEHVDRRLEAQRRKPHLVPVAMYIRMFRRPLSMIAIAASACSGVSRASV